jgi:DNA-directed RNA polymerase specialized sigma24 family protein
LQDPVDVAKIEEEISPVYAQILRYVDRHLSKGFRPKVDANEIVVSTFKSFFASDKTFSAVDDLRAYMFKTALKKTLERVRAFSTEKRDISCEVPFGEVQANEAALLVDSLEIVRRIVDMRTDVRQVLGEDHLRILDLCLEYNMIISSVAAASGLSNYIVNKRLDEIKALFARDND